MIEWFLVKFFGYKHRFRVAYEYRVDGKTWWTFKSTVSLTDISDIDDHKVIRNATGPFVIKNAVALGGKLKNGSFIIEPICYLGFWR